MVGIRSGFLLGQKGPFSGANLLLVSERVAVFLWDAQLSRNQAAMALFGIPAPKNVSRPGGDYYILGGESI